MVDHVLADTGFSKVAYIGHSQGNATMFAALASGMLPDLGTKLSVFVALAPAVYAGPLTTGFPFGALKGMRWRTWRKVFGILDFIPLMRWSYDLVPSRPFGLLGYQMFAFLFGWTDAKWLKRRKAKMFRFTPSPVSSASVWWWTGYQGRQRQVFHDASAADYRVHRLLDPWLYPRSQGAQVVRQTLPTASDLPVRR